jgi:hypothetical protein
MAKVVRAETEVAALSTLSKFWSSAPRLSSASAKVVAVTGYIRVTVPPDA